jgi:hypothetical protein
MPSFNPIRMAGGRGGGFPLTTEHHALLCTPLAQRRREWHGRFRNPLQSFTSTLRPARRVAPLIWQGSIRSPKIAEQAA